MSSRGGGGIGSAYLLYVPVCPAVHWLKQRFLLSRIKYISQRLKAQKKLKVLLPWWRTMHIWSSLDTYIILHSEANQFLIVGKKPNSCRFVYCSPTVYVFWSHVNCAERLATRLSRFYNRHLGLLSCFFLKYKKPDRDYIQTWPLWAIRILNFHWDSWNRI